MQYNNLVIVVIKPIGKNLQVIADFCGKNNCKIFLQKNIDSGNLIYMDKKTSSLANHAGVQFPGRSLVGHVSNIATKEDIVNAFRQNQQTSNQPLGF